MKVILAHGSPDSTHAKEVEKVAAAVSKRLGEAVAAAFLSDNQLPRNADVVPLFLGAGVHLTKDTPRLAENSDCTLLPSLGSHTEGIVTLVSTSQADKTIFLLYQPDGFERLQAALQPCGQIAFLHGEPSLSAVLQQMHEISVTVQPLLLFPGRSLARVRAMVANSSTPNARIAPVLCELDGFAELVANCFRGNS
ncbi:Sirohydrochlorin ferrochelatase [Mariprofundus aestuarium]|uniref:Sirohydrochlorin ferrochelatase n=1 Tax=Mariprofundus aestuarium TaxID=1921086 RepID=A0A2K8KVA2_MARES|nr:CbiX/SirB N-terminal domain-containing protein [Mariprofundus aestuarium]ATX78720.1 Sirohydrochlorin ferrochelatase [Mariprofundus aestuarium]